MFKIWDRIDKVELVDDDCGFYAMDNHGDIHYFDINGAEALDMTRYEVRVL